MTKKQSRKRKLPAARTITLPDKSYQPAKGEQEREHDMPGATTTQMRSAFFRPFNVRRKDPD